MECTTNDIMTKIILIILLSGIIGLERELRHKGAGLRTHILVGVSSTLVVLTSFYLSDIYKNSNLDPSRLLHGVITGIGFLCAGTILRAGNQISGLTTAASLWTVACIGMAVGSGQYLTSIIFTVTVTFVLIGVRYVEQMIKQQR
ncbi:MAG: MgtC/SapB family protein [Candidatus Omnitrophota bacterium]